PKLDVSRTAGFSADVAKENPGATAAYSVHLWDGAKPVDTLANATLANTAGGMWNANPGSKSVNFIPPTDPLNAPTAKVQYVLVAEDMTHTVPADITITFSRSPVAYNFSVPTTDRSASL